MKFFHEGCCTLENQHVSIDSDYVFKAKDLVDEKPFWKGFKSTKIHWNSLNNVWQIVNIRDETVIDSNNGSTSCCCFCFVVVVLNDDDVVFVVVLSQKSTINVW